jgi:hypothetical protein
VLLLSACGEVTVNETRNAVDKPPIVKEPKKADQELETSELLSFFMENGTVANYLGEGNEYASYQSRTQWHNDNTISLYEDNGGSTFLRTYRITKDSIDLIKEQGEFYEEFNPTDDELNALPALSTFLQLPLEEGAKFEDWVIVGVKKRVETPYQTFENVIVLEQTSENGAINRKYIVKDYGEIKREFIMKDDETEYFVTSALESVK